MTDKQVPSLPKTMFKMVLWMVVIIPVAIIFSGLWYGYEMIGVVVEPEKTTAHNPLPKQEVQVQRVVEKPRFTASELAELKRLYLKENLTQEELAYVFSKATRKEIEQAFDEVENSPKETN